MTDEQPTSTSEETTTETTVSNSLQEAAWGDNEPSQTNNAPVEATSQQTTTETKEEKKEDDEEVIDTVEWVKREFGVDTVEALKAEREEYKALKSKTPEEIKFADDQSKVLHELIRDGKKKEVKEFLETQERLETIVAADVTKENADEILKLAMKLKYKDLTENEINHKFKKQFSLPKEPVLDVDDEDSVQAHNEWKEQVMEIENDKVIEAKLVKPDLVKFKSELVLPEIQKSNQGQKTEPTPEELEQFKKDQETFLQSAQVAVNGFAGISVGVKDKDVDYTVNYAPSQEEKTLITTKLNDFAGSGFDANSIFVDRWLNEDGKTMNVAQMTEDLSRIFIGKNSDLKLATDSANKRLEAYLKEKKQINVNETNAGSTFNPSGEKTGMDAVREQAFA